jgi:hypothetical protein
MRSDQIGAIPLTSEVNVAVGDDTLVVSPPDNDRGNIILYAQKGDIAIRAGSHATEMALITADPAADIADGTGWVTVHEGAIVAFVAREGVTLRSFAGTVAPYWWV